MNTIKIHSQYSKLLLLFVVLLATESLFSQTKYTVILPDTDIAIPNTATKNLDVKADESGNETEKSFFKFNFTNIPLNVIMDEWHVKLYAVPDPNKSAFSSQIITLLKGSNTWTGAETHLSDPALSWEDISKNKEGAIGRAEVTKKSVFINMKIRPTVIDAWKSFPYNILSLAARSPSKGENTQFYSSITSETPTYFSKKPKLVVSYEVEAYPFREDWSQAFSNAQHISSINWKTNETTTKAQVHKLQNTGNDYYQLIGPTGAVLVYKNLPIVFTQSVEGTGGAFSVKQLDSKGAVLWSKVVDNVAKCWPMIDELGRLYYISASDKISVLDLNNKGDILYSATLADISVQQFSTLTETATLGYDGTLYLPTDTGVFALSAYPQLKIRWKYPLVTGELNGPVSLSPDESKAFFINANTTQKQSRMIVLDNIDGTPLGTSNYDLGEYKSDCNHYIPAPVVQNDTRVFILNGYDNSNKLFVYDVDETGITKTQTLTSGEDKNTGISQPVIDVASNVYFVYNNKLALYNATDNKASVFKSDKLNNASILVTDASLNIYALDLYSNEKKIFGLKNDTKDPDSFSVNIDENTMKHLVLAPDGTLYTVTANNLIAITPKKLSVEELIVSELRRNTVYRGTESVTVNETTVLPTTNAIINSGGTISFKPGFTVQKGAQLTCKTGY